MGRARAGSSDSIVDRFRQRIRLLRGITAGNLPESAGKVPEIASQIRDPKGMLLTPEQRVEPARSLLSTAFGLALVNSGWKVHSSPGEFHLDWGDEQIDPHKLLLQISDGVISKRGMGREVQRTGH